MGGLTGTDYLIYGTITRFGSSGFQTDNKGPTGIAQFGGIVGAIAQRTIQKENVTTEMGVDLRVTDVATGHILFAGSLDASITQRSSTDPFADVQRALAAKISEAVVTSRIPIKVIAVQDDGTLILNYGSVFPCPR